MLVQEKKCFSYKAQFLKKKVVVSLFADPTLSLIIFNLFIVPGMQDVCSAAENL